MISLQQLKPATVFPVYDRIIPQYLLFSCDIPHLKKVPKSGNNLNRPVFPGEDLICELRLPDHCFRWRHNKLFLLLPEEYGPAFPAIVDCYTSPPHVSVTAPLCSVFPALTVYYLRFVKAIDALRHRDVIRVACTPC